MTEMEHVTKGIFIIGLTLMMGAFIYWWSKDIKETGFSKFLKDEFILLLIIGSILYSTGMFLFSSEKKDLKSAYINELPDTTSEIDPCNETMSESKMDAIKK